MSQDAYSKVIPSLTFVYTINTLLFKQKVENILSKYSIKD